MRTLLLSFFFLLATYSVYAQPCSLPGMTPQTAIAVCGTTTFVQNSVTSCQGPPISGTGACGGSNASDNAFWYKFHCYQAGTLGFVITPMNLSDDYDWELFDVTNVLTVNQVYTDETLMRSLNLCGSPNGITGCTPAGIDSINCGGATNLVNRLATLIAGHDYLLMVNNWSNSGLGYSLSFTGGTAVITNNVAPVINSVTTLGCNTSALKVVFSKDIRCSSVTLSGSEFSITPGAPVITGVTSTCSSPQGTITELTIQLQNPLAAGNYNLIVNPGIEDGDTFKDVCGVDMATGFTIPFTVAAVPPVAITGITYTGCAPIVLDVALSKPVWCTSITQPNFSEFSILPGNPAITSIQSVCGTGPTYTSTVQIVLQNPLPPGNYQLVINNGGDGNTLVDTCNNQIPVGNSTPFNITVTTPPPVIQSIGFDECHPDKVVLNFDKPIRCASISAAGDEFYIIPVWPVASISYTCTPGGLTSQVIMNLGASLPAGTRNVVINNSIFDGNTLSDSCFSFIPPGYSKSFTATQAPPPIIDSVQFNKCSPSTLKIFYNHPIVCSSIIPSGVQFFINGSSTNIVSATGDATSCVQGYSHSILLQLATPITTGGNYTVGTWLTNNPIYDTCIKAPVLGSNSTVINIAGKPSAVFTSVVNWGCVNDNIVLSHPGGNGVNSWNWSFSDGSTATGQNVSVNFPVATPSVTVQLIVSNGSCNDTTSQTITLGNVFTVGFTTNVTDTFCINTPVNFTNTSTGNIVNYLWDFGDGTQFIGPNPPTHVYLTPNLYNVQLTVTDNHGCTSTHSKLLTVNTTAYIDFAGLKPQYCTGNTVLLTRKIAPTITSYVWDNGDGKIFTNEVDVNFSYANEGVYTITLTGQDKYCGTSTVSKTVPVYAVPKVALGPDTILCMSDVLLLGIPPVANHTYLWNSGETTSQIYTSPVTRTYELTADNNGCRGYDAVSIKVLNACLIRVPGAFTPNGDGTNDYLKALNADLAKDYSFKVFNRLGQLVFATRNPLEGWDGRFKGNPESTGTFVWMLSYIDPWSGRAVKTKGTSILIR